MRCFTNSSSGPTRWIGVHSWYRTALLGWVGVLMGLAPFAFADDGYYSIASSEYVYGSHVRVQMVRERVQLYVDMAKLKGDDPEGPESVMGVCDFVFKNHGPATTVTIAFPEDGDTTSPDGTNEKEMLLSGFRSFINGRKVPVRAIWSDKLEAYQHVKKVKFLAGQTLRIRDVFRETISAQDYNNLIGMVPYLLGTGGSWHRHLVRAEIDLIEENGSQNLRLGRFPRQFAKKYWQDEPNDPLNTRGAYLADRHFGPGNSVWVYWHGATVSQHGNVIRCIRTNFKPVKGETCTFFVKWVLIPK